MSRQIPILVDPGYEANFRSSRRGSEPVVNATQNSEKAENAETEFEDPARSFHNRKFMRRHSEDPNTSSWKTYNFHASPRSFVDEDRFAQRRGSVPVNWGRPQGRRDRFQEIVERMMSANDDELLSGIMEDDFGGPFEVEEVTEEYQTPEGTTTKHQKFNRSPSAPAGVANVVAQDGSESAQPSVLNYTRDKNGCIDIPVQIYKSDETKARTQEEKSEQSTGKIASKKEKAAEGKVESRKEGEDVAHVKKEKNDTDKEEENAKEHVVTISVGSGTTQENIEPSNNEEANGTAFENTSQTMEAGESKNSQRNDHSANQVEQINQILNVDDKKLFNIKKIEEDLDKAHEQIEAFEATDAKDSNKQLSILEELLMKSLMALDAVEANGSMKVKEARKIVVMRVQADLKQLEKKRVPVV